MLGPQWVSDSKVNIDRTWSLWLICGPSFGLLNRIFGCKRYARCACTVAAGGVVYWAMESTSETFRVSGRWDVLYVGALCDCPRFSMPGDWLPWTLNLSQPWMMETSIWVKRYDDERYNQLAVNKLNKDNYWIVYQDEDIRIGAFPVFRLHST